MKDRGLVGGGKVEGGAGKIGGGSTSLQEELKSWEEKNRGPASLKNIHGK